MKILVDGDACPTKDIIVREAKSRNIPVIVVIDTSHEYSDGYSRVITVDKEKESADIKIINLTLPKDIVITQDFGLAAMALAKGASALDFNGNKFTDENIDELLFKRHLGGKIRRGGGKTNTIKKRTKKDNINFEKELLKLMDF